MPRQFRKYTPRETEFYRLQHANQTLEFVENQRRQHLQFNKGSLTVPDLVAKLNQVVDESDPDNEHTGSTMTQELHNLQTAAAVEQAGYPGWMVLVAFLHDGGKILVLPEYGGLPQWSVVGDTFVVGAPFPRDSRVVFPEFFDANPDSKNKLYQRETPEHFGMYRRGVGLNNVLMSFGHDEYMFQVITNHYNANQIPEKDRIPPAGLAMVRFHSFYPWHTGYGTRRAYTELEDDTDRRMLHAVRKFSQGFDLYSKRGIEFDATKLEARLKGLADRYLPGKIAV